MNVPRTCVECRFWEKNDAYLGCCSHESWCRGYRIQPRNVPSNGVLVEDDEGWGFFTGPDFGCIHWKGKED